MRKVLGYVVLFWFFLEVKDLFLYLSEAVRHTYFSNLLMMVDMLAVPVCTFYLFELLSPGWMNWKRAVVIELFLLVCIAGYILTASELWMEVLNFYVIFYSIVVIRILRDTVNRYNRYIQTNYSNTERINVRWLCQVTFFMFLCLSVWMYSLIANSWFMPYRANRMKQPDEELNIPRLSGTYLFSSDVPALDGLVLITNY